MRAQIRKVLESSFARYQADSAIVMLALRLTELEAQRDATAEGLPCSYGDVREYLTLRDQLGQAGKSGARARKREARDELRRLLSGMCPGDVLALTRGRKACLCVIGAKATSASGRAQASVIGEDAAWRALVPEDVCGAIAAAGHTPTSGGSVLRRTKERTRIAGELRSDAAKGIYEVPVESIWASGPVLTLCVAMCQHPVHRCLRREEHAQVGAQWVRLAYEIDRPCSSIDSQTGPVAARFDCVCAVPERLGLLAGDEVIDAGQRLRRIFGECDLAVVMSMNKGTWNELDEAELASIVSTLIYDSRFGDDVQQLAPVGVGTRLQEAWYEGLATLERVHRIEKACSCDLTSGLDAGLMAATLVWAYGSTLATTIDATPIQAGDFVRWMCQVMDCLGRIASTTFSGELARKVEVAKDCIGCGVAVWSTV